MSNQQKDNQAPGSTGAGSMSRSDTTSPGLRRKDKDDTGGPRGDELSNAVGAAAGGDPSSGSIPPPTNKGGASSA